MIVFKEDEPSEFQCNSCKNKYCYFQPNMAADRGLDVDRPITIPVFISRFGCASHSDINMKISERILKEEWCGGCGFKGSPDCDDKHTWKRCRMVNAPAEIRNMEEFRDMCHESEHERTLNEVVELIEDMGDEIEGWGFIVDKINKNLRKRCNNV